MAHVLLVDDEPSVLAALQRTLRQHFGPQLEVEALSDPIAALARARDKRFDLVISDLRMPEVDGIAFLTLMAAVQPDAVRMVLTGSADFATAQQAINEAGAFRYLCKPWQPQELVQHVQAALQHGQALMPALTGDEPTSAA